MKTAPTKEELWYGVLLGLADTFEAAKGQWFGIEPDPSCPEEFEPLRECLAEMIAEGWLAQYRPAKIYALTPAGYRHFLPRIQAMRALGR
jgi:hypothetical protein